MVTFIGFSSLHGSGGQPWSCLYYVWHERHLHERGGQPLDGSDEDEAFSTGVEVTSMSSQL